MKKKLFIISLCIMYGVRVYPQKIGIDGKGKSIFTHISKSEARFEFSSEEPLSLSYLLNSKISVFSLIGGKDTTVVKFSGIFGQISMLNSGNYLILNDLLKMKPGVGLRLGYQQTIDEFKNIDMIPKGYFGTYTFGINALFKMDNIKLYNTDNNNIENKLPITFGAEGNLNIFFKNKNKQSKKRMMLALNSSIIRTWNDDMLLNYKKISDVDILPSVVALEDFDGRYGKLDNGITSFRASVALPVYFGHFNPIPYSVLYVVSGRSPRYHFGVFTNVLRDTLTKKDFKIPASIGLGVETVNSSGHFTKPSLLIKGAISFGKFK